MSGVAELTYLNGVSALIVAGLAFTISGYFLLDFIRKRKRLTPFVALMTFCLGTFSLGPSISLFYLLTTGIPFSITIAGYLSYTLIPVAINVAMFLGFTLFQPDLVKKVLIGYGASGVLFYIFIFGFPNLSLGGELFASIPDTTLKGVPLILAVIYILSAFFILGRGFYKLARRITDLPKKKKLNFLFWGFLVFGFGSIIEVIASSQGFMGPVTCMPVDEDATNNTINLYRNLKRISGNVTLFGQQDSTTFGINANGTSWWYDANRSDVNTITGSFPAVYGYDLGGIEPIDNSGTEWARTKMAHQLIEIEDAFARGGVITLTWHCWNFVTGNWFYDTAGSVVPKILPGGALHDQLNIALDRIAAFVGNLEDGMNRSIPILFRPWHENNGGWFWWGAGHCTPEEYKQLYRYTFMYLTKIKQIHNFLWVYSPNDPLLALSAQDFLESYPGDDCVDILALDTYQDYDVRSLIMNWKYKARQSLTTIVDLATSRGKLVALSEVGVRDGLFHTTDTHWFVNELLDMMKNDPSARQACYCLVWGNVNTTYFCVPYPGQQNVQDFIDFYDDPYTGFQVDIAGGVIYQDCLISGSCGPNFNFLDGILLLMNWTLVISVMYYWIRRGRIRHVC